jgi:hypothetical protein
MKDNNPPLGKTKKTERGFDLIEFKDRYDAACSLQQSSLASESAIWLGIDDPNPQVMASKAHEVGVSTSETTGWVPYPIPKEVFINTRMHLTRTQVEGLIRRLLYWLDHDELF